MNKVLKLILCILKNATVIIPLIEGVVHSVQSLVNQPLEDCKDGKNTEDIICNAESNSNER